MNSFLKELPSYATRYGKSVLGSFYLWEKLRSGPLQVGLGLPSGVEVCWNITIRHQMGFSTLHSSCLLTILPSFFENGVGAQLLFMTSDELRKHLTAAAGRVRKRGT